MDEMPANRASWKVRLVAFGIGIIVAASVFGIALVVSDDLRLLYFNGALVLAVAAFLLGARAPEDWIAVVLLLVASTFLFALFVLPQTMFLWPTLVLWAVIVILLVFRDRLASMIRIGGAIILVAVSAQRRNVSLPVAFDPEQRAMLTGFPTLVVIDRTSHVRLTHTGYNSPETSFRHDLTQLLQSL